MKLSGIVDKELVDLLNKIGEKVYCVFEIQESFIKTSHRFFAVARFNDVIPMELKEINRFKILHLMQTRYYAARTV